jgi:hypothetical protein
MEKEITDNAPEAEEVVEVAEVEADAPPPADAAPEMSPDEGIQQLKKQLAYEQQARAEAERNARQANSQVRKAYSEVEDTNYQLVVNAIDTVKGRAEALKVAYRDAMSVGDYDKVADLQEAMSINAVQHSELEKGRSAMESRIRQMQAEAQAPEPVSKGGDHIEQLAASVSSRSANWLRRNREAIPDERAMKKMFRAHEDAVDEGIEPDSDAYFNFIEGRLGVSRQAEQQESPLSSAAAAATPRRSSPPASAPVTRSGNGAGNRNGTTTLSAEEKETARSWGWTEKEYADQKLNLKKEGRLQ